MANFKVWAQESDNLVDFNGEQDYADRAYHGLKPGDSVQSNEINTILRQNSLITAALATFLDLDPLDDNIDLDYNSLPGYVRQMIKHRIPSNMVTGTATLDSLNNGSGDKFPVHQIYYNPDLDKAFIKTSADTKPWRVFYETRLKTYITQQSEEIEFTNIIPESNMFIQLFGTGGGVTSNSYSQAGGAGGGWYTSKIIKVPSQLELHLRPLKAYITINKGKADVTVGPNSILFNTLSPINITANSASVCFNQYIGGRGGSGGGGRGFWSDYGYSGGEGVLFGGGGGGGGNAAYTTSKYSYGGDGGIFGGGGGAGGHVDTADYAYGGSSKIKDPNDTTTTYSTLEEMVFIKDPAKGAGGEGGTLCYNRETYSTPGTAKNYSIKKTSENYPAIELFLKTANNGGFIMDDYTSAPGTDMALASGGRGGGGGIGSKGGDGGTGGVVIEGTTGAERSGGGGGGGFFGNGGNGSTGIMSNGTDRAGGGGGGGGYFANGGDGYEYSGGGGGGYGIAGTGGSGRNPAGIAAGASGYSSTTTVNNAGGTGICIIYYYLREFYFEELFN